MAVLVVNCGSSSIKYRLYEISDNNEPGDCLAEGLVERIGTPNSRSKYKGFKRLSNTVEQFKQIQEKVITEQISDHEAALNIILSVILDKEIGVINDISDIKVVGHRVVHGSDQFVKTTILNKNVKEKICECSKFAPLHNPVNLLGVEACEKLFPAAVQTGVFDTAFHATLPPHAYLYAIPYSLYKKHSIRRYGFHGTSHKYVSKKCIEICKQENKNFDKIIVCHLGNGASISAIKDGKSMDTSMGFTPLEGLIMGSRCGDIDPGVLIAIQKLEEISVKDLDNLLNKSSGFMGITEETSDSLVVEIKALEGSERHRLALTMFNYRIKKYIGAYAAAMGGLDAVVFTGGIGENSAIIREEICSNLEFLGIEIDKITNSQRAQNDRFISIKNCRVSIMVIPTNEEFMIASESLEIYK